jgi:hypothetical protein
MELLYSHMRRSPLPWLEQSLKKGLLIGYQPPLIIDLFFILDETLSPDLGLLFLYLLCDQVLESEVPPFLEEMLNVFKFFLAVGESTKSDLAFVVRFQLN